MKVSEVYDTEENVVYNRITGTWRHGTEWEKVVEDGGKFWMIYYREAEYIDRDDALLYKGDKEAIEVELVDEMRKVGVKCVS